jgi:hypothetical protein
MKKIANIEISNLLLGQLLSFVTLCLFLTFISLSCGSTAPNGTTTFSHDVRAVLSHDGASTHVIAYMEILRDGEPFTSATVTLEPPTGNTTPIVYLGADGANHYRADILPTAIADTSFFKIRSTTENDFNFNFSTSLPDTFSFRIAQPARDTLRGSETVNLEWNASKFATGYFVIIKPTSPTSTAVGFAQTATQGVTAISIPNDPFRNSHGDLQPGTYNIWVVGYRGAPVGYTGLPFDIPAGIADNVKLVGVTGRVGAMYFSKKVLTVETNP